MSDVLLPVELVAPVDAAAAAAVVEAPPYKLYSAKQMAWSSFIGGPLAGTWMIRANFRRLGQLRASNVASLIGGGAMALVVGLTYVLERKFGRGGNMGLGVGLALATKKLGEQLQGRVIAEHERAGGRLETVWKSMGVTVLGVAQTLLGAAALVTYLQTTVVVGGTHKITLEGMAEKADAERLGAVLTDLNVFRSGADTDMTLERGRSDWTVSFHATKELLESADVPAAFTPVAKELRDRLYGGRFHLAFLDDYGLTKKRCELGADDALTCR